MKRTFVYLYILFAIGCGSKSSSEASALPSERALSGAWSEGDSCSLLNDERHGIHFDYIMEESEFSDSNLATRHLQNYSDAECTIPNEFSIAYVEDYSVGDTVLTDTGVEARAIEFQNMRIYSIENSTGEWGLISESDSSYNQIFAVIDGILYWGLWVFFDETPTELNFDRELVRVD